MTHLSPEELLDIAEGAQPRHVHLESCDTCREEVAGMRALMGAVAVVDVPEPSPLFWDHLSARVHDAVAVEVPPRRTRFDRWEWVLNVWSWRLAAPIAAVAVVALVVAVFVSSRGGMLSILSPGSPGSLAPGQQAASLEVAGAGADVGALVDAVADPSYSFVADLTSDMDMDTAIEAGLVSDGSAEHAVTHLNEGELRELAKLLTEQIAHAQAS
jgi:hypothetical protein